MQLREVFDRGHTVALPSGSKQLVVCYEPPGTPTGYYGLQPGAIEVITIRRTIEAQDLGERLKLKEIASSEWLPAVDFCWCDTCSATRNFRVTLTD